MARRALAAAMLAVLLVPAAHLAWVARDMPHLGHLHDDSIYWVAAKSLAQGHGYRILSLPEQPFETKYPPLFALALSLIWKLNPQFPENLQLATVFAWVWLPIFLALAWLWLSRAGFGIRGRIALCAVLALSPWVVFLSTTLMSELMFSSLLIASVLSTERAGGNNDTRWACAAGFLAALAYLTKAAALPLIVTAPLWLVLRRRYRTAASFVLIMLPAVAWWTWWSHGHMTHSQDVVSLYYTNYLGYQIYNVASSDLPLVIWKNLDGVFSGIAGLMIFDLGKTVWGIFLSRLLAIAAIAGAVRLARQRGFTPYHGFAAAYVAILLVWHYPPNERFMLPVFPLVLAGLGCELARLGKTLRRGWPLGLANRVAGVVMAGGLTALACFGLVMNSEANFAGLPGIIQQHRTLLKSDRVAFDWIAHDVPQGNFYAYEDPVFFLYTGRKACSMPVAPMPFYREDREAILRPFRSMASFARDQRLGYLFLTAGDFHRDLPEAERAEVRRILAHEPSLDLLYRSELASIYRVLERGETARAGAADAMAAK